MAKSGLFIIFFLLFRHLAFGACAGLSLTAPLGANTRQTSFERLLNRHDGILPFPFSQLLTEFGSYDQARIPFGRSSLAQFTNRENSRTVISANTGPGQTPLHVEDLLFVGHVASPGIVEAISINEEAGKLDFFFTSKYTKGKTPEVRRDRDASCTECHQFGYLVYPRGPWSEVVSRTPQLRPFAYRLSEDLIDFDVEAVNSYLDSQRFWKEVCGPNPMQCRRRATILALWASIGRLKAGEFDPRPVYAELVADWKKHWPEGGVHLPEFRIPDRKPAGPNETMPIWEDPRTARPWRAVILPGNSLPEFDNAFNDPAQINWQNYMIRTLWSAFFAGNFLNPLVMSLVDAAGDDNSKIIALLNSVAFEKYFEADVFRPKRIINALLSELDKIR